ncbi:hypothetical protein OHAE_831 [Ochrobactrum soli]|uniref:Uncharacterized protein n=1 Tax=Ochrobactrum soli TaxID=2448455 RepID=A0A2P9HLH6_9HYPH|nr:hypothetical protein OHAE_831 [[Ochrobactrum] soli]
MVSSLPGLKNVPLFNAKCFTGLSADEEATDTILSPDVPIADC